MTTTLSVEPSWIQPASPRRRGRARRRAARARAARPRGRSLLLASALLLPACVANNNGYVQPTTDDSASESATSTSAGVTTGDASTGAPDTSAADTTGDVTASSESLGTSETGETGETDGPLMCIDISDFLITTEPEIMFVIDKSGSMIQNWDDDNDPDTMEVTRWRTLHKSVWTVLEEIENVAKTGLVMFPSANASTEMPALGCLMNADGPEVDLAYGNHMTIMTTLPPESSGFQQIQGGTPASAAIATAAAHLDAQPWNGQLQFIVYITDGLATCGADCGSPEDQANHNCLFKEYDDSIVGTVFEALFESGIITLVIGVDIQEGVDEDLGVSTFDKLNDVAAVGGVGVESPDGAKFLDASNKEKLEEAFSFITQTLTPCHLAPSIEFPPDVEMLEGSLHVKLNGVPVYEITADACIDEGQDGWAWIDEQGSSVVLCGDVCDAYQNTEEADLEVRVCLE